MPYTITIAQQKGGAGKTTLACHLTAAFLGAGRRVAALDLDPQGSFSLWASLREERFGEDETFDAIAAPGFRASTELRRVQSAADIIVIDTPPHAETAARQAIRYADLVVIPMQLTPFDLAAVKPTAGLVGEAKRKSLIVFNRVPPRSRIGDEIRKQMKASGAPVADTYLGSRTAYAESILTGRGVTEAASTGRAATEISALATEILALAEAAETKAA